MLVICNPKSDKDFRILHNIICHLPTSSPRIRVVSAPGEAAIFAKKGVKRKEEVIVVIGDDRTVSEILPIIMFGETKLAIIPIGKENEIARNFKIPIKPRLAIKAIIDRPSKSIDVMEVRGEYFLRSFELGSVAPEATRLIDAIIKKISFKPFLFSLHEDGKEIHEGKTLRFEAISRPTEGLEVSFALSKIESFGFGPRNHRMKNGKVSFFNDRDLVATVDRRSFLLPKGDHEIKTIPKAIRLIQVS